MMFECCFRARRLRRIKLIRQLKQLERMRKWMEDDFVRTGSPLSLGIVQCLTLRIESMRVQICQEDLRR